MVIEIDPVKWFFKPGKKPGKIILALPPTDKSAASAAQENIMSTAPAAISGTAPQTPATPIAPAKKGFIAELHTFAAWAESELAKLVKAQPKIEQIADATLKYAGGAASIIAGIEGGPAAGALVGNAVSGIQTDIVALNGLITDFGATPTAASIATSIANNADALLTAGHVTNPTSVAAAKGIVTNLTTLATALSTPAA